jgi:hypothetical protein
LCQEDLFHGAIDARDVCHQLVADGWELEVCDQGGGLIVARVGFGLEDACPQRARMFDGAVVVALPDRCDVSLNGVKRRCLFW